MVRPSLRKRPVTETSPERRNKLAKKGSRDGHNSGKSTDKILNNKSKRKTKDKEDDGEIDDSEGFRTEIEHDDITSDSRDGVFEPELEGANNSINLSEIPDVIYENVM